MEYEEHKPIINNDVNLIPDIEKKPTIIFSISHLM